MLRAALPVLAAAGVISAVTAATRLGDLSVQPFAASPQAVGEGRVWLLVTSALLADRPAVASVAGFAVVGLAGVVVCGARATWLAAGLGHVVSAAIVYGAIGLARGADPTAFQNVVSYPDYGTSAIVAAWIGALAYVIWSHGRRGAAIGLCTSSAVLGWYFKGDLTVLDLEHAFALACGAVAIRFAPFIVGGAQLEPQRDELR